MQRKLSYCDFCKYHTASGCMTKPNSTYCADAKNEYWTRVKGQTQQPSKSIRPWEKRK